MLLEKWKNGTIVNWDLLYDSERPQKLRLPKYPFSKERYWMPLENRSPEKNGLKKLHPLVHENISTVNKIKFKSVFNGKESFLEDHVVNGIKVFPGVAYLELIRVAGELTTGDKVKSIKNITWVNPITIGSTPKEIEINITKDNADFNIEIKSKNGDIENLHCEAKFGFETAEAIEKPLQLQEFISTADRTISGKMVYTDFADAGLNLGDSFQRINTIYVKNNQAVAQLNNIATTVFDYDPGLLDSALHTIYGVAISPKEKYRLAFPYHIDEVVFHQKITPKMELWAAVTQSSSVQEQLTTYDVDLTDDGGNLVMQFKAFVAIPFNHKVTGKSISNNTYLPLWQRIPLSNKKGNEENILIITGKGNTEKGILSPLLNTLIAKKCEVNIVEELTVLEDKIDTIYFVQGIFLDELEIEKTVFKTLKKLSELGKEQHINLCFFTFNTQAVYHSEEVNATGSGIIGLVGSVAKEYPNWNTKIIDLDEKEWNDNFINQQFSVQFEPKGKLKAYRNGFFYEPKLSYLQLGEAKTKFKTAGTYIILGGAGGIGAVTTEYLSSTYQANIIWLGRSELTEKIKAKQDAISQVGPKPYYIQCNALQLSDLKNAKKEIKDRYGAIDGLFHSAIVLNDMRFEEMDEVSFNQAYMPKALASENFIETFKNEPLEFVCFYSSIQAQWNAIGQANYAAGCTFKDSYARQIKSQFNIPSYTINWGYWGEVGIVSGSEYAYRMEQIGIGSISNSEGMLILENVLSNDVKQVVAIKLEPKAKAKLENLLPAIYQPVLNATNVKLQTPVFSDFYVNKTEEKKLRTICEKGVLQVLLQMGFRQHLVNNKHVTDLQIALGIQKKYRRLLKELLRELSHAGYINYENNEYYWNENKKDVIANFNVEIAMNELVAQNNDYAPYQLLLQASLNKLSTILTGVDLATEVIFPGGSTELVAGIYKGNKQSNHLNNFVADTIAKWIAEAIKERNPADKIQIIEVGAGTGGTSQFIFEKLVPYKAFIEYTFTDVSKSFLIQAESNYKEIAPYLKTQLFDVEKEAVSQGITLGTYDIVLGANVIHATENINNTITNLKQVLKPKGLLLLNELATTELFTTLTFGLLDGWWLYNDTEIRLPGSPGLSAEKWKIVLEEEGFESIKTFPENQILQQQIIIAESNGLIKKQSQIKENLEKQEMETVHESEKIHESETVEHEEWIINELVTIAAETIKYRKEVFDIHKQFMDYGFDSILGATLIKNINKALHISLRPTEIFNYPNISQLANYIKGEFSTEINQKFKKTTQFNQISKVVKKEKETTKTMMSNDDIAIVGMSGQFGAANDLEAYWEALSTGKSLIEEVPKERWDKNEHYSIDKNDQNKTYSKWGSFLKDVDKFDPLFFGISGGEAEMMDPQQRLFLQHAWKAVEDAGINPRKLSNKKCGVYIGASTGDYLNSAENKPAAAFWGNSCAILPARISYFLNLKGPALPIDTACSSSLVALDISCKSLINGDTDIVITGGVTIMNTPTFYKLSSRAGMLSADGTCYAFDHRANGFVPGEGIGVLVLKRLTDAERDGDVIHGIVKGTMVNQDGTSNGILAPSVISQETLEKETYEKFNIDPKTISYVEAHGTGTALGDPIEFEALTKAFKAYQCPNNNCAIGSVKTNIGHTLMAAGVAGIIKVVLSFKNKQLPPSLNFETANPLIDFETSPFKIQNKLEPWEIKKDNKRTAAVSSFGFSGTNAHVILQEYSGVQQHSEQIKAPVLILISAKTIKSLKSYAKQFQNYLTHNNEVRLVDIAYTLQHGRNTFTHKFAVIVQTKNELLQVLADFVNDENSSKYLIGNSNSDLTIGNTNLIEQEVQKALKENELNSLMKYWLNGSLINWSLLNQNSNAKKVSIPTYVFEKHRYWKAEEEMLNTVVKKYENNVVKELDLYHKTWEKGVLESGHLLKGETLIISNKASHKLSDELQKIIGHSKIVNSITTDLNLENVAGCIDLRPMENEIQNDLDWLIGLQKLIKNTTQTSLNLIVVNQSSNISFSSQFGLYEMLQAEYSKVNSLHLELEHLSVFENAMLIAEAYQSASIYTHIKYSNQEWNFPTLQPIDLKIGAKELSTDNPILITGGTGDIGMICAKYLLCNHGFKKIILIGEKNIPHKTDWKEFNKQDDKIGVKIKKILELEGLGGQVQVIATENLDFDVLKTTIKNIEADWGPIKGILHCAGILDTDTPAFISKDCENIAKVLFPKGDLINQLDQILAANQLDFSILFSSISTFPILGAGQSDYVMANSYLNAFATHQQKLGKPCTSVVWPNWEKIGLKKMDGGTYDQLGLSSISVNQGLNLIDKIISNNTLPAVIIPLSFEHEKLPFKHLFQVPKKIKVESKVKLKVKEKQLNTNLLSWLQELVARELKFPVDVIDVNLPLQEFGVDSVILVQFIKVLEKELQGINIEPTAILENPSVALLAVYIQNEFPTVVANILNTEEQETIVNNNVIPSFVEKESKPEQPIQKDIRIAVVAMACHFPEADNIKEFWENLKNGKDAVSEVPKDRWCTNQFYSPIAGTKGKSISKWGGFLKQIENFDPAFFGINKELASQIDPLQRQWLEVCTEAIADAGYETTDLSGKNIGVYAGGRLSTFRHKIKEPSNNFIVGTGQNFITAHLSHIYNLKGPNMVVDTACSSALTAIDLAVKDLKLGETDMAFAGGVDILLDEEIFVSLSHLSILSPSGRSKTFDQSADGTGLGEGCGAIILKRLDDAIEAGDKIYGIIEGTAVNNDGRTMGITTPNPKAQEELIEKGIKNAGITGDTIGYIESHGTGTLIGDPIELKGVSRVLRKYTTENGICGIGSVKSNIGHLLSAAGIAGVIKTLLAIQAKQIPPTIHCNEPNRRFDFDSAPVYPVRTLQNWEGINGIRRAGVSSFGLGGNNAFVILSNEGIPAENQVPWPLKITPVDFNKERYWPEEEKKSNQQQSYENKVFAQSLTFKILEV